MALKSYSSFIKKKDYCVAVILRTINTETYDVASGLYTTVALNNYCFVYTTMECRFGTLI